MFGDIKIDTLPPEQPPVREEKEEALKKAEISENHVIIDSESSAVTEMEILQAVERVNHAMELFSERIQVRLQKKDDDRILAHVVDSRTSQLLRVIPIDKVMEMDKRIQNMLGLFVDQMA